LSIVILEVIDGFSNWRAGAIRMVHYHRRPAAFLADAIALDFLNSRTTADGPFDWLSDGAGVLNWLEQAKLVPRETLQMIKNEAVADELDKVAVEARDLREWFRSFVLKNMGRALSPGVLSDLEPLNRLLERGQSYSQLVDTYAEDRGFELRAMRRCCTPDSLLLPIGEALAKFACDEDFSFVKACEGQNCTFLFADHTRRRGRRWCSMAVCGNRAKAQAHRHRIRQTDSWPESSM
jgi:predicted RNA-binding Zn ribbon-like protein